MEYNIRTKDEFVVVYLSEDSCVWHDDDFLTKEEALSIAEEYIQIGLEILNASRGIK